MGLVNRERNSCAGSSQEEIDMLLLRSAVRSIYFNSEFVWHPHTHNGSYNERRVSVPAKSLTLSRQCPSRHEHPVVDPHVSHFMQVPLRSRVKLPHSPQASPS